MALGMDLAAWRVLLSHRLEAVARADSMRAIREGLLWVLPCLMVSAVFLVLSVLARVLGLPPAVGDMLAGLHGEISRILPLLIAASIGYMLAIRHQLPRLPVAFLCFVYVALASYQLSGQPRAAATLVLFIAIASPLINVPLMARLMRVRWLQVSRGALVSDNVEDAVNMVVPGIVTAALLAAVLALLQQWSGLAHWSLPMDMVDPDRPYFNAVVLTGMNSLLWFFGIHGYHALQPLFQVLEQAVGWNAIELLTDQVPQHPLNAGLLGAFAFIGGAGGTLSLVVAVLWRVRSPGLRLLAVASLPMALLNVNELLLFGIPLILNPRLLIPFILVPAVNACLALAAVQAGWVPMATVPMPLNAPVVFNAYVSTQGAWSAVALQLALVLLGACIYAPAVRALERHNATTVHLPGLDTTFTRLQEEGSLYAHDPIVVAQQGQARREDLVARVRRMGDYEFFLEYQPQVSQRTGLCVGCEALLRARDSQGRIQAPGSFLAWLSEAGLMKEVDLWVAAAALRQYRRWRNAGFELPVSINVTGPTLMSPAHCQRLVALIAPAAGCISIEITEDALAADVAQMRDAIARVHAVGAKVSIDDFGTGYSSLSYLHAFAVDTIKIDRSFVVTSTAPQGARVLEGLLHFCQSLGLGIVVEGVETDEQLQVLPASIDLRVQGWYYSRALAADDLPAFVQQCAQGAAGKVAPVVPTGPAARPPA